MNSVLGARRWQSGLALLVASMSSAWAAAAPDAPVWQVREVSQQSPARVPLVGGWFVLGSDQAELDRALTLCRKASGSDCAASQFAAETPARRVFVRSFEIDRLEVSNAAYQRCVDAGRCLPPRAESDEEVPAGRDQPVVRVNWREGRDYCRFMGGDLPSEAQWEYAAHGDSQRSFPWGDTLASELANYAGQLMAVGAHPQGKSFFGVLNMAGNVWELVLDRYVAPYSSETHSVDPVQLEAGQNTGTARVMRGGSYRSPAHQLRARARVAIPEDVARPDVGLRCAYP